MSEQWLTFREAVEIVRVHLGSPIGRAEGMLHTARASKEVRFHNPASPILLLADDGVVGMHDRFGRMTAEDMFQISREDLLDWLDRQALSQESKSSTPRTQVKRDRVREAIDALWPAELPSQSVLPNALLCTKVADWLKADCQKRNVPAMPTSDDTILRAACRKK